MPLTDALGWCAAALMVATFSCRNPLWMRPLAVCTNLAFIGYAFGAGLPPVLALHALLMPVNLLRWWQCACDLKATPLGCAAPVSVVLSLSRALAVAGAVSVGISPDVAD